MPSGKSTGQMIGTVAGAIVGLVAGWGNPATAFAGASLGASAPPAKALPPGKGAAPRHPTPPGLAALLNPLLRLPFRLGARDPEAGYLDCGGLLMHLLEKGLGVRLPLDGAHRVILCPTLAPVWQQAGEDTCWPAALQPWDTILWYDAAAAHALTGDLSPEMLWPGGASTTCGDGDQSRGGGLQHDRSRRHIV